MTLSNFSIIPGLHANIFSVTQALQFFNVTLEFYALIFKKNSTDICFHEKIVNQDGKWYLLTTNFYNGKNDAALLVPNKNNMEGNAAVQPEGTTVNKNNKQQPNN